MRGVWRWGGLALLLLTVGCMQAPAVPTALPGLVSTVAPVAVVPSVAVVPPPATPPPAQPTATGPASPPPLAPPLPRPSPVVRSPPAAAVVAYTVLPGFDATEQHWLNVVVRPGITPAELIALGRALHQRWPLNPINIFDDTAQFQAFVQATIHYDDPADYPPPESWTEQHLIGFVQKMASDTPGGTWQLLDNTGASLTTLP